MFTKDYELRLVGLLASDGTLLTQWGGSLRASYFSDEIRPLVMKIIAFHQASGGVVSPSAIYNFYANNSTDATLLEYLKKAVRAVREDPQEADAVRRSFPLFLRYKMVLEATEEFIGRWTNPAVSVDDFIERILTADQLAYLRDAEDVDLLGGDEEDVLAVIKPNRADRNDVVPTGWRWIDEDVLPFSGGLEPGMCGLIVGAPKSGKTCALITIACNAARAGRRVLYLSMEGAKRLTFYTIVANLTGRSYTDVHRDPQSALKARERVRRAGGRLVVRHQPQETWSVQDVERWIIHCQAKFRESFDVLVVDYAKLLRMSREHREDISVVKTLRGLIAVGGRRRMVVWTASQAHPDKLYAPRLTMEDIADAKLQAAEATLAVGVTKEATPYTSNDVLLTSNKKHISLGRLSVIANRYGPVDVYRIGVQPTIIDHSRGLVRERGEPIYDIGERRKR